MANTTYYGSLGAAQALNYTVTVPLSGGSGISGARIDSVVAAAFMSTNAYTNTYQVRARLLNSVGATLAEVTRDIKFDSENYTGATWYFDFGTSVDVNSIASISYFGLNDASKIFAKSSQSVTVDYTTYTACGAPTWVGIGAAMAAPGEGVSLSWSGASDGAANPIIGYIVQRSENGGGWSNWATTGATSYTVYAHSTYGNYYDYRIVTDGQQIDSGASASVRLTTYTPTACGAPSAGLSASLAESAPNLNYSGASGGTINAITGYEILYADSADGSTWGGWNALRTVSNSGTSGSTTADLPATRGHYRKFAIRTLGSAGASYYSGWAYTGSVRYNSIPTAPTLFSASPAVYVSGTITLAYSGSTDADNNISTYNVQYATSPDGISWGAWVSLANGATTHTPTLSPGHYIKYQARAVDALGVTSGWTESNQCGKNTAPSTATIDLPQDSKTIYNSKPRILVTLGVDAEGHTQTINAVGFTPSRNNVASAAKIILRRDSAASAGAVAFAMTTTDQYGEASPEVTRSLTYADPNYTDANLTAGTTPIKAAHMTELRDMVENVRAYYGLNTNLFSETDPNTLVYLHGVAATKASAVCAESPTNTCVNLSGITRTVGDYVCYLPLKALVPLFGTEVKTYTISFWIKANSNQTIGISPNSMSLLNTSTTSIATAYKLVTVTVRVSALNAENYNFHISLAGAGLTDVSIYGIKIECGSVATSWTNNSIHWGELIVAGITKTRNWAEHIAEMRNAINDVVTLVNGWDTASTLNRIPTINWIPLRGRQPQADALEQIRQVIAWL